MKKVKKILDIEKSHPDYFKNTALSIRMCSISHTPVHFHPSDVELIFCLKGRTEIICNHEHITLMPGDIMSIYFDDMHCVYSEEDNLLMQLHIDLTALEVPWDELKNAYFACQDKGINPYQNAALQKIKDLVVCTTYLQAKEGKLPAQKANHIANSIISIMSEYFNWFNYREMTSIKNDELKDRISAIMGYCMDNYADKITISQLAQRVHIDPNYLSQFIRKSPYGSFNKMMGFIRCFHAQYLLLNSTIPVSSVARECGFSDEKYFYKYFNYWWEKTPTEHRNQFKEYIKKEDAVEIIPRDKILPHLQAFIAENFTERTLA